MINTIFAAHTKNSAVKQASGPGRTFGSNALAICKTKNKENELYKNVLLMKSIDYKLLMY